MSNEEPTYSTIVSRSRTTLRTTYSNNASSSPSASNVNFITKLYIPDLAKHCVKSGTQKYTLKTRTQADIPAKMQIRGKINTLNSTIITDNKTDSLPSFVSDKSLLSKIKDHVKPAKSKINTRIYSDSPIRISILRQTSWSLPPLAMKNKRKDELSSSLANEIHEIARLKSPAKTVTFNVKTRKCFKEKQTKSNSSISFLTKKERNFVTDSSLPRNNAHLPKLKTSAKPAISYLDTKKHIDVPIRISVPTKIRSSIPSSTPREEKYVSDSSSPPDVDLLKSSVNNFISHTDVLIQMPIETKYNSIIQQSVKPSKKKVVFDSTLPRDDYRLLRQKKCVNCCAKSHEETRRHSDIPIRTRIPTKRNSCIRPPAKIKELKYASRSPPPHDIDRSARLRTADQAISEVKTRIHNESPMQTSMPILTQLSTTQPGTKTSDLKTEIRTYVSREIPTQINSLFPLLTTTERPENPAILTTSQMEIGTHSNLPMQTSNPKLTQSLIPQPGKTTDIRTETRNKVSRKITQQTNSFPPSLKTTERSEIPATSHVETRIHNESSIQISKLSISQSGKTTSDLKTKIYQEYKSGSPSANEINQIAGQRNLANLAKSNVKTRKQHKEIPIQTNSLIPSLTTKERNHSSLQRNITFLPKLKKSANLLTYYLDTKKEFYRPTRIPIPTRIRSSIPLPAKPKSKAYVSVSSLSRDDNLLKTSANCVTSDADTKTHTDVPIQISHQTKRLSNLLSVKTSKSKYVSDSTLPCDNFPIQTSTSKLLQARNTNSNLKMELQSFVPETSQVETGTNTTKPFLILMPTRTGSFVPPVAQMPVETSSSSMTYSNWKKSSKAGLFSVMKQSKLEHCLMLVWHPPPAKLLLCNVLRPPQESLGNSATELRCGYFEVCKNYTNVKQKVWQLMSFTIKSPSVVFITLCCCFLLFI